MRTEAPFRNHVAELLKAEGYLVSTEEVVPSGGRCDIVGRRDGVVALICEVKLDGDLSRGLGQIITYGVGLPRPLRLILAVPTERASDFLRCACEASGVELLGFDVPEKPVHVLPCGCVVGKSFCEDADSAWREVGLARQRDDLVGYGVALRSFGAHLVEQRNVLRALLDAQEDVAA